MAGKQQKMKNIIIPRLQMRGIHKSFGATVALDNVDFSVKPGQVHALVGENGAGKSTLMKILSGVYNQDRGDMLMEGEPYQPRNPLQARLKGVGMIYQELTLVPHLSVEENILLGIEPTKWGFIRREEIRSRALNAISDFQQSDIRPDVLVGKLSVGVQQLVEIGRSLALGSRILVFDEPTSSLGHDDTQRLFELIKRLKKQGLSIVYISHFLDEVFQVTDKITVLRDGAVVGSRQTDRTSLDDIVKMMIGREIKELYPRSERKKGNPVLEVKDLSGSALPRSVSLTLHEGEIVGIFGLVGAGSTELLRVIFGLNRIKSGSIRVGVYSGERSPSQRWKEGVGFLSEYRKDEGLAVTMSVADNMTLSQMRHLGPMGLISRSRQNKAVQKWIDLLDIRCRSPEQTLMTLSGGNQQKTAFARLLYHDVDVLLLDEPTRGIDVAAKAKIYRVIDEMASSGKKAILMISSELPELLGLCDRIAVMHRGELGPATPVEDVDEHRLMAVATR